MNNPHHFALDRCGGKVLVGGLGLGSDIEYLATREGVKEIVVVEIDARIIKRVWHTLNVNGKPTRIVNDNIFNYLNGTTESFDCAYFDITTDDSIESYQNIVKPLRASAERTLPPEKIIILYENEMKAKLSRNRCGNTLPHLFLQVR